MNVRFFKRITKAGSNVMLLPALVIKVLFNP